MAPTAAVEIDPSKVFRSYLILMSARLCIHIFRESDEWNEVGIFLNGLAAICV
jgi:hypothetical protein